MNAEAWPCKWCHGRGRIRTEPSHECQDCRGRGVVFWCPHCTETLRDWQCPRCEKRFSDEKPHGEITQ